MVMISHDDDDDVKYDDDDDDDRKQWLWRDSCTSETAGSSSALVKIGLPQDG